MPRRVLIRATVTVVRAASTVGHDVVPVEGYKVHFVMNGLDVGKGAVEVSGSKVVRGSVVVTGVDGLEGANGITGIVGVEVVGSGANSAGH